MKAFNIFFDRSYGYIRALITLICGTLIVIYPGIIEKTIIITIGIGLIVIGLISIAQSNTKKAQSQYSSIFLFNSIMNILFGVVLLVFPSFFSGLIWFVFGLLTLLFGIGELSSLIHYRKIRPLKLIVFIPSIITTICGVVILFNPFETRNILYIFFGIVLIFYGISELISSLFFKGNNKYDKTIIIENSEDN